MSQFIKSSQFHQAWNFDIVVSDWRTRLWIHVRLLSVLKKFKGKHFSFIHLNFCSVFHFLISLVIILTMCSVDNFASISMSE